MAAALAVLLMGAAPADRFPQPVRVGDLAGRKLIGPAEAQPLLGHVEGVDRSADGGLRLRVRTWRWVPWASRVVDVRLEDVALLGEEVALLGLTAEALRALPPAADAARLEPDATVRIGLVRPFH